MQIPASLALGKRIGEVRRAAGLTQAELVAATRIPHRTLQGYEAGEAMPTAVRLAAIARALGTSVEALLEPEEAHS